jgi:hypothetical protein
MVTTAVALLYIAAKMGAVYNSPSTSSELKHLLVLQLSFILAELALFQFLRKRPITYLMLESRETNLNIYSEFQLQRLLKVLSNLHPWSTKLLCNVTFLLKSLPESIPTAIR